MKLHEIINNKNNFDDKEWEFRKELNDFNSIHLPNGRIDGWGNMVVVAVTNILDWSKPQHHHLCMEFGLKLVKVEKREYWDSRKHGYELRVFWYYASEQDTNFNELNFDKVNL